MWAMTMPHEALPPPFKSIASSVLMEDVEDAEFYLTVSILVLLVLIIVQLKAFSRPPPVPLKRLPRRPALNILFQPDDISSTQARSATVSSLTQDTVTASKRRLLRSLSTVTVASVTRQIFRGNTASSIGTESPTPQETPPGSPGHMTRDDDSVGKATMESEDETEPFTDETPFWHSMDLPDSFAPLLSSSHVEVLRHQLTADLIHACHVEGGVRLKQGRHEIPLDKDNSRPQLVLEIPKGGCRLSAAAAVGSDGFSSAQDLDVNQKTTCRSKPMVKHAGLVLDPPLPLSNVAPTLIHFPTLFEDSFVPTLRRIQIVRFFLDFIVSISSFLEKCLWIIESKCQIHLSKVRITPIYKGRQDNSPEWRLSLAFSGHLLLFGLIPIPFISVTLPTFIIPQPHALLDYLLSSQPLASARLRRENIAEERIALALLNAVDTWNSKVKIVATPPAVGVDVTLPGGVTAAVEIGLGRDPGAGRSRNETDRQLQAQRPGPSTIGSQNSLSSWTTHQEQGSVPFRKLNSPTVTSTATAPQFDANQLVPWFLELKMKGSISQEKMSVHILKCEARHEDLVGGVPVRSQFGTRGSLAIWRADPSVVGAPVDAISLPLRHRSSFGHRKTNSFGHAALHTEDTASVAAILLFPDEITSLQRDEQLLQYDYAFDVFDDTKVDAITVSVGATHPMLKGGTMVTTILDSIYAFGSFTAREDAVLDPRERRQKRNILRHLPAADFTFGIQDIFIPPESHSYSDDGQTLFLPEMEGGRMMVRVLGGIDGNDTSTLGSHDTQSHATTAVNEGVKVVADFEVASFNLKTEGVIKEFPELDIFEGDKLRTNLAGIIGGRVMAHLRSQKLTGKVSTAGPNVFNPLEAYEIDFSRSNLHIKMKEYNATLGHRRVIFPTESTFLVDVIESVVDMGFEGKTQCDLLWDFQGLSPMLQVTSLGQTPEKAVPENKEQVSLLIAALRQGRISFHVSSVGGISVKKAATSREDMEGLFDWKFFNALVSPDEESAGRILDVLHDKRTMDKVLQVTKLINEDLHRILSYALEQVWRAKEVLDQEGVSDPGHAIPMYKMARLISLFVSGDIEQVDEVLPVVRRVVAGEGLDVVKVKALLRDHLDHYEDWASELDRAVRWASVLMSPMAAAGPYVEDNVRPLAELPRHAAKFRDIPSAKDLYERLHDKPHLPLDPVFSNLVSQVAPYLSFKQIRYFLQVRASTDWQPSDLRRVRYVYSIKRKVLDIAESYGGLSFLPQSFLVSVFLGEATRTSLRASPARRRTRRRSTSSTSISTRRPGMKQSAFSKLRRRRVNALESRLQKVHEIAEEDNKGLTPAERVSTLTNLIDAATEEVPENLILDLGNATDAFEEPYELGDSLLGPQDVAILLQSGLTSVMKSSTVVQLNQRMLLDLICSQPRSFAVAVLAEIGTPSGQGSPRGLTPALMALLELDQTAFKEHHQIDVHALLESWLPGLKIPRREDYMAGGRWARQSYYEALFSVATSILEDAETYMAVKGHVQRVRQHSENDPVPHPRNEPDESIGLDMTEIEDAENYKDTNPVGGTRLNKAIEEAKSLIVEADEAAHSVLDLLIEDEDAAKESDGYEKATALYNKAFEACRKVLGRDKHAFHARWFREFYKRNYDALMIKSMFDNVINDVDNVRYWLQALRNGAKRKEAEHPATMTEDFLSHTSDSEGEVEEPGAEMEFASQVQAHHDFGDRLFMNPELSKEQILIDAIIDAAIFEKAERERLRSDPLVRLLIPNPPGHYNFAIVSAMGVITEGKRGLELKDAFERLAEERGVQVVRSDTGTARSFEYNASKIEEAVEATMQLGKPYGLLGYSQGCANILWAETMLLSGSPQQRQALTGHNSGLVCRQLIFSAANGSFHGPAAEKKMLRLIVMCEEFFKYQQGYVSRALSSNVLESLISLLDSAHFHKFMGGANSFLPDGCRAFWREAQHLAHVPTCTLRGVMENHTTPESLEMISHLLTKQSGSPLHDSQVHVFDAVGHPVYHHNRNGRLLKRCAVGEGAVQRTHHWSPLSDEVEFVRTNKDIKMASFDCAKDRHVYPWVEVNARFGFIKYATAEDKARSPLRKEVHPMKLVHQPFSPGTLSEKTSSTPHKVALYSLSPSLGQK